MDNPRAEEQPPRLDLDGDISYLFDPLLILMASYHPLLIWNGEGSFNTPVPWFSHRALSPSWVHLDKRGQRFPSAHMRLGRLTQKPLDTATATTS